MPDDSDDNPETCIVCGGPEPCSHDFDKLNADLEDLGRRMGSGNQGSGLRVAEKG